MADSKSVQPPSKIVPAKKVTFVTKVEDKFDYWRCDVNMEDEVAILFIKSQPLMMFTVDYGPPDLTVKPVSGVNEMIENHTYTRNKAVRLGCVPNLVTRFDPKKFERIQYCRSIKEKFGAQQEHKIWMMKLWQIVAQFKAGLQASLDAKVPPCIALNASVHSLKTKSPIAVSIRECGITFDGFRSDKCDAEKYDLVTVRDFLHMESKDPKLVQKLVDSGLYPAFIVTPNAIKNMMLGQAFGKSWTISVRRNAEGQVYLRDFQSSVINPSKVKPEKVNTGNNLVECFVPDLFADPEDFKFDDGTRAGARLHHTHQFRIGEHLIGCTAPLDFFRERKSRKSKKEKKENMVKPMNGESSPPPNNHPSGYSINDCSMNEESYLPGKTVAFADDVEERIISDSPTPVRVERVTFKCKCTVPANCEDVEREFFRKMKNGEMNKKPRIAIATGSRFLDGTDVELHLDWKKYFEYWVSLLTHGTDYLMVGMRARSGELMAYTVTKRKDFWRGVGQNHNLSTASILMQKTGAYMERLLNWIQEKADGVAIDANMTIHSHNGMNAEVKWIGKPIHNAREATQTVLETGDSAHYKYETTDKSRHDGRTADKCSSVNKDTTDKTGHINGHYNTEYGWKDSKSENVKESNDIVHSEIAKRKNNQANSADSDPEEESEPEISPDAGSVGGRGWRPREPDRIMAPCTLSGRKTDSQSSNDTHYGQDLAAESSQKLAAESGNEWPAGNTWSRKSNNDWAGGNDWSGKSTGSDWSCKSTNDWTAGNDWSTKSTNDWVVNKDWSTKSTNDWAAGNDWSTKSNNAWAVNNDWSTKSNNDWAVNKDWSTKSTNDWAAGNDWSSKSTNEWAVGNDWSTKSNNDWAVNNDWSTKLTNDWAVNNDWSTKLTNDWAAESFKKSYRDHFARVYGIQEESCDAWTNDEKTPSKATPSSETLSKEAEPGFIDDKETPSKTSSETPTNNFVADKGNKNAVSYWKDEECHSNDASKKITTPLESNDTGLDEEKKREEHSGSYDAKQDEFYVISVRDRAWSANRGNAWHEWNWTGSSRKYNAGYESDGVDSSEKKTSKKNKDDEEKDDDWHKVLLKSEETQSAPRQPAPTSNTSNDSISRSDRSNASTSARFPTATLLQDVASTKKDEDPPIELVANKANSSRESVARKDTITAPEQVASKKYTPTNEDVASTNDWWKEWDNSLSDWGEKEEAKAGNQKDWWADSNAGDWWWNEPRSNEWFTSNGWSETNEWSNGSNESPTVESEAPAPIASLDRSQNSINLRVIKPAVESETTPFYERKTVFEGFIQDSIISENSSGKGSPNSNGKGTENGSAKGISLSSPIGWEKGLEEAARTGGRIRSADEEKAKTGGAFSKDSNKDSDLSLRESKSL